MKNGKKETTELASFTRVTIDLLGEEIAGWFAKRGVEPITKEDLAKVVKALYKHLSGQERDITRQYLSSVISCARKYLEPKEKKTIVSMKGVGFKLATPKEATVYATQIYKSFLVRGTRVERAIPLVDRKHLPSAMEKVFDDSRALLSRFTRGSEPLLLAIEEAKSGKESREGKD
jgi:hypothetical protein